MYINPCNLSLNPKNTGVDCDSALLATALLIFLPQSARWTDADVLAAPYNGNFTAFVEAKIHAVPSQRWFPIFGNSAPINVITEANEADVTETLDDGSVIFIRYGKANRTFATTKGGYCLAQKLMQFPQGYSFIEFDQDGKGARYQPNPGVYAGFPTIMLKGLSPDMAGMKTSFKNKLMITFDKVAYFVSGKLLAPDSTENILAVNGLLDVDTTLFSGPTLAGQTAPTGGTSTVVRGATNDTIDIKINGVSLAGPVIQTSSETTDTLLAVKIKNAINAATATNGGITATNAAGVLTYVIPGTFGASLNTLSPTAVLVGTVAATHTAFTGGVTGTAVVQIDIFTDCADTDMVATYPTQIVAPTNFVITDALGNVITKTIAIVAGHLQFTIPELPGTYTITPAAAATLKANGIIGFEIGNTLTFTI